jgi:hypothetical protein
MVQQFESMTGISAGWAAGWTDEQLAIQSSLTPTIELFQLLKQQFQSGSIDAAEFGRQMDILTKGGQAFEGASLAVGNQLAAMVLQFEEMTGKVSTYADGWTDGMLQIETSTSTTMGNVTDVFSSALGTITTAASDFWNWLVGGSIWPEGMDAIDQSTRDTLLSAAAAFQDLFSAVTTGAQTFWATISTMFTEALAVLSSLWQTSWIAIRDFAANTCGEVVVGLTTWYGLLQGLFAANIPILQQTWSNAWMMMQQTLQNSLNQMSMAAQSVLGSILMQVQNVMMQIQQAAAQLQANLVTHSIWPDMFGAMGEITETTMAQIEERVLSGFARTVAAAQASLNSLQSIQQQAVSFMSSYTGGGNVSQAFLASQQAAAKAATSVAGHMGTMGGYDIGTVGQALANQGYWNPATSMNLNTQGMAVWGQALADATEIALIQSGKIAAADVPKGFGLEQYIPSYQTDEGEFQSVRRTGLATVHEGEVIGRPSDVNLQNTVNVQVDGATVAKTVEQRMISQRQLAGA